MSSVQGQHIVVIRANGERTEGICEYLVRRQADNVIVIHERPFINAIRKMIDISLHYKWLIVIDADEFIKEGVIKKLLNLAENEGSNFLSGYGLVDCKLLMKNRIGIPRIYRTEHLKKAIIQDSIRPECDMCQRFEKMGFYQKHFPILTAKHDYEQWYVDIYRKAQVHRIKHHNEIDLRKWAHLAKSDMDYHAAYNGWFNLPLNIKEKGPIDDTEKDKFLLG